MLRKHIARLLRIALCAALINAFAPTISYVLAASAGKNVVEICTSFGLKKVLLDTGSDTPASEHVQDVRCKFCLASMNAAAFITLAPMNAAPAEHAPAIATGSLTPPASPSPWPDARPRAPPPLTV